MADYAPDSWDRQVAELEKQLAAYKRDAVAMAGGIRKVLAWCSTADRYEDVFPLELWEELARIEQSLVMTSKETEE